MELEDTYGVKMSEQEAEGILTVGQAVDFVAARAEDTRLMADGIRAAGRGGIEGRSRRPRVRLP